MSDDPRLLRCSDADREAVAEVLRMAAGDGRLSLEELEERLEQTYRARTYADLEPVLADLPGSRSPAPLPVVRPVPATPAIPAGSLARVGGTPGTSSAVAVFSGATFKGDWVVPSQFTAFAMFGGVDMDLRQARFEAREVVIQASAIFGGVSIVVPEDVVVHVNGAGIFGGFDGPREPVDASDAVVVRVTGVAIFGGVDVRRKPPKKPKGQIAQ
jgi:hypothetical protein